MARKQARFMNGIPELLILRLLAEEEMYGYELVREIRLRSHNEFPLGEGVIYPILHTLEADGLLNVRSEEIKGRTRRYYTLNRKGKKHLAALLEEYSRVRDVVTSILGEASRA